MAARSRPHPRVVLGVVAAIAATTALSHLPTTSAQFTATTSNLGSSFAAATDFCAGTSETRAVAADAWIDEGKPNDNYGDDKHLEVIAQPNPDPDARILLLPDLPPEPTGCTLASAVLVLDEHGYEPTTLRFRRITSPWTELGVTWNTAPSSAGPQITAATTPVTLTVDITALITSIYSSGNNYGIEITDSSEQGGGDAKNRYHALEHDSSPPGLITYTWA